MLPPTQSRPGAGPRTRRSQHAHVQLHPGLGRFARAHALQAMGQRVGHVDGVGDMAHRLDAVVVALLRRVDHQPVDRGRAAAATSSRRGCAPRRASRRSSCRSPGACTSLSMPLCATLRTGSCVASLSQRPSNSMCSRLRARLGKYGCQPRPTGCAIVRQVVEHHLHAHRLGRQREVLARLEGEGPVGVAVVAVAQHHVERAGRDDLPGPAPAHAMQRMRAVVEVGLRCCSPRPSSGSAGRPGGWSRAPAGSSPTGARRPVRPARCSAAPAGGGATGRRSSRPGRGAAPGAARPHAVRSGACVMALLWLAAAGPRARLRPHRSGCRSAANAHAASSDRPRSAFTAASAPLISRPMSEEMAR